MTLCYYKFLTPGENASWLEQGGSTDVLVLNNFPRDNLVLWYLFNLKSSSGMMLEYRLKSIKTEKQQLSLFGQLDISYDNSPFSWMYLLEDLLSLNIKPESSPRQTIPKRKIKIDVMIIVSISFSISTKYNMKKIHTKDILVFNSSQFTFIFWIYM